ncbi:MAG: histidine phosphatase family protein [Solirubrobacteraceae bacterium]
MSAHGSVAGTPAVSGSGAGEAVLVRHAETEWSLNGRHTGRTDIPLTEHGRAVATALRERLSAWQFDLVLVSPSVRARETCELCGLGAVAQVRPDLLEWDYGDYEGLTSLEIRAQRPDWLLWRDGCPGGESPADIGARADRVIEEIAADGHVAVFSHGHMLRVLGARWIALGPDSGGRLGLSTAAICVLGHERQTAVIARWNDTGL